MTTQTTPAHAIELAELIDAGEASAEAANAMRSLANHVEALTAERNHWKANHDAQVQRARVLIDRPDIPLERVKAYEQIGVLTSERDDYRVKYNDTYAALDDCARENIVLTAERDEWKSKHFAFKDRDDMRDDAERYRFLRSAKTIAISREAAICPVAYDAAIDAEMKAAS